MKLIIDADACPRGAFERAAAIAARAGIELLTVANFNHEIISANHIVTGGDPQEADIRIINLSEAGDLIVTQDIGLAAMALGKRARAISPSGFEYRQETMDASLEERELKARYRRSGGRTKGPHKRAKEDDERFAKELERMISEAKEI
ncbi:MAG: DUF188 domain-containing protein [Synergistaceae bacterium]|nr:DUF188 domain-containing protein [Synergistaceae bacterium]